jgi:hypothetical protein
VDTETLGKLIELFAQLGAQGTTAFIVWLSIKYGVLVLGWSILGGTVITVVTLITRAVARSSGNEQCLRDLGKVVGVTIYYDIYSSNRNDLLRAVEKLASAKK